MRDRDERNKDSRRIYGTTPSKPDFLRPQINMFPKINMCVCTEADLLGGNSVEASTYLGHFWKTSILRSIYFVVFLEIQM